MMSEYNLTSDQKELLRRLVEYAREYKTKQFPYQIIRGDDREDVWIMTDGDESIRCDSRGDLSALFAEGLLHDLGHSFAIRQSGLDAVANDFQKPAAVPSVTHIGAIIGHMGSGNVLATGFAQDSTLQQLVDDTALLESTVDDIADRLLDAVRTELPGAELREYVRHIDDLKTALLSKEPDPSAMQRIAGALAFFGDIEGSLALTVRALPYVGALLALGERLLR